MRITVTFLFLTSLATSAFAASTLEMWKKTEDAAAAASKIGHYREAEALLLSNQKLAEVFPPKDARLPRTLFDLAQVYRAERKYLEALGLYERARQLYVVLYGGESGELAQTLDGEGELYKNLGDFEQAEPLLLKSLEMRNKQPPEEAAIAQSKSDLVVCRKVTITSYYASKLVWRQTAKCPSPATNVRNSAASRNRVLCLPATSFAPSSS